MWRMEGKNRGDVERSPEPPSLSLSEKAALARAVPPPPMGGGTGSEDVGGALSEDGYGLKKLSKKTFRRRPVFFLLHFTA